MNETKLERVFQGNGVSSGIALGQALRLDSHNRLILKLLVEESRVEDEVQRLQRALEASREQLRQIRRTLVQKVGAEHAYILDVHSLMLEDERLTSEIVSVIREKRSNAEWAVREVSDRLRRVYDSLEDRYFRERGSDIENVVERILQNLAGGKVFAWDNLPDNLILVAHDFSPSSFATMDMRKVCGLVLESGGRTCHTAIIARSLRLPAVMEVEGLLSYVAAGDVLLINGDLGQVVSNPSAEHLEEVRPLLEQLHSSKEVLALQTEGGAVTRDGTAVTLQANTELPGEVRAAKRCGAQGIGLFRSEFVFFSHPDGFPTMEEQLEVYSSLAREMAPHAVAIRTLDTGADKIVPGMEIRLQPNPGMGLRGIRLSLLSQGMFRGQVEAVLRAASAGRLELLLPMVSSVDEVLEAKALIDAVRSSLPPAAALAALDVPVGVMIEIPAAVVSLESLARETDFLCVGTNDLIQYMLAVDRGNSRVSHLFQPLHPSILLSLWRVAGVARAMGKPVRICGEVSSNPLYAVLLVGMGFTQLSMNAASIPVIRKVLARVSTEDCRQIAQKALGFATARQVLSWLVTEVSKVLAEDLTPYVRELGTPPARVARGYAP